VFAISSALTYLHLSWYMPLFHTSRYVSAGIQFYQAFPHVSTASGKRWGEKAWVRGYELFCRELREQQAGWKKGLFQPSFDDERRFAKIKLSLYG